MIPRRGPSHSQKDSHRYFLLICTIVLLPLAGADARPAILYSNEPVIRVSLADKLRRFSLDVNGKFTLKYQNHEIAEVSDARLSFGFSENGIPIANLPNQQLRFLFPIEISPGDFIVDSVGSLSRIGLSYSIGSGADRAAQAFPGSMEIFPEENGTFRIVNLVPLETYLRGVVPNELVNNLTPDEFQACMAQAIAARNYAFFKMNKEDSANFDVYSDTRDQVYSGVERYKPIADSAIKVTSGMIVEYNGQPARCFFHSSCGGRTESVQDIWQGQPSLPYLQGVSDVDSATGDPYCIYSPNFFWTVTYSKHELDKMLMANLASANPTYAGRDLRSDVTDVKIIDRFDSFRVDSLKITTRGGNVYYVRGDRTRYLFRNANGTLLRSSLFRIVISRDSKGRLKNIVIKGQGTGHGVGMCQWGAIGMSRLGFNYLQILSHYYPGTEVKKVY